MSEETSSKVVKTSLGVVGAAIAIASIVWFAIRPRFRKHDEGTN